MQKSEKTGDTAPIYESLWRDLRDGQEARDILRFIADKNYSCPVIMVKSNYRNPNEYMLACGTKNYNVWKRWYISLDTRQSTAIEDKTLLPTEETE